MNILSVMINIALNHIRNTQPIDFSIYKGKNKGLNSPPLTTLASKYTQSVTKSKGEGEEITCPRHSKDTIPVLLVRIENFHQNPLATSSTKVSEPISVGRFPQRSTLALCADIIKSYVISPYLMGPYAGCSLLAV